MITDTRDPEDFEDIENHESEKDDIYNESYTERNVFKMNEQITNILEAFKSGVLSTEEATAKLNVIQESTVEDRYAPVINNLPGAAISKLVSMMNNWDEKYFNQVGSYSKSDKTDAHEWEILYRVMGAIKPRDKFTKEELGSFGQQRDDIMNNHEKERAVVCNLIKNAASAKGVNGTVKTEYATENDLFMAKQNHIMESYKLGIINSQEAIQLIERITMESEYMTEEDDMDDTYTDDDNNEPETSDSSEDISALAEYINSLDEETRAQLMGAINAPAEGNNSEPTADDDVEGNDEGNNETVEEGSIPEDSDTSDLNEMEV